MDIRSVSIQTLQRLPLYLNYLKGLPENVPAYISATTIAEALHLNDVQVRKDLAAVSSGGRPKVGYLTTSLIYDIEQYLGYDNTDNVIIVGAGNLGKAILSYQGLSRYGMDIVAAFDSDEGIVGTNYHGKQIFSMTKLKDLCRRMKIKIAVITVPDYAAQEVCDLLVESGISAILNFTAVRLKVPQNMIVKNENMEMSLIYLAKQLTEKRKNDND